MHVSLQVSSMLQLRPVEEDESAAESLELNRAAADDDHFLLANLLSQERYRKCINQQSGWGIPGTPLRMAASKGICITHLYHILICWSPQ